MNPIYFNLTPDGINYLTISSMDSNAELIFAPLYNSNTPEAQQQLFYTFSDDPTNCVININNSTQGTLIVSNNTLSVTWYAPSSPDAWNLGSYGILPYGGTLETSMQLVGTDPAQYLGSTLDNCLVPKPLQWTFSPPLVLALNTAYSLNNLSDQTCFILTEAQSDGGDSIPVALETAIAEGQIWTITQGTLSNGVVTNAQILTPDGYYLAGLAAGQAVTCSKSWGGSWTITDNGDGTATFECLANGGSPSFGFLTSNGASGAPTLQPGSGASNQKWKFTTTSTKGKGR